MDLFFKKPGEVLALLAERLRLERLHLGLKQSEVAKRAGVAMSTISNLENGQSVSLDNWVRVTMALGRVQELEALFLPKLNSVDEILRYEESSSRQRMRNKP
ncbi:helix-turn-helix transcriptional regulator [Xanthomonas phaseoli pv. dieffenbachiae]|uniref:helix-turn-helix domain-containing protein n=1 Tax=Xanthomonas TaxID=338 RepID=UPI00038246A6|nr:MULTISPECIES: helix-turn-helix transcriptional regulator [Xanthomonas]MBO9749802.1 helix-turn-helix transcriptional regulator [Xanthomonas phaseoli pv. dieffenbachiae]MBO9753603.1 helix-turn-helix transcriptional regulator [Xanthomonas phaseoli pv. dieffenbachiae]MBO9892022.1 helix-turn-helix transcriptional regulator [Xanthomonas sp. D-36-1]OQP80474.1 transcriptional regulator [Xanthomonas citri]